MVGSAACSHHKRCLIVSAHMVLYQECIRVCALLSVLVANYHFPSSLQLPFLFPPSPPLALASPPLALAFPPLPSHMQPHWVYTVGREAVEHASQVDSAVHPVGGGTTWDLLSLTYTLPNTNHCHSSPGWNGGTYI